MSEEILGAAVAVVTQVLALVILLLKGRKTAEKVAKVETLVNGHSTRLEGRLMAQEATITRLIAALPAKRGRPRKAPVTDADVGGRDD